MIAVATFTMLACCCCGVTGYALWTLYNQATNGMSKAGKKSASKDEQGLNMSDLWSEKDLEERITQIEEQQKERVVQKSNLI